MVISTALFKNFVKNKGLINSGKGAVAFFVLLPFHLPGFDLADQSFLRAFWVSFSLNLLRKYFAFQFSKDMLTQCYTNYINNFSNTREVINVVIEANHSFKQLLEVKVLFLTVFLWLYLFNF